jgi:hypothetical protein
MVGSLVVVLPSEYSGGAVTVEHRGERKSFRRVDSQARELSLLAFYADCQHTVSPIKSGVRVAAEPGSAPARRWPALRYGFAYAELDRLRPKLVVLSPGPARPSDFGMRETFAELARRNVPVFGVCLGLQGMVEYCGGALSQLATPVHGKASAIACLGRSSRIMTSPRTKPCVLLLPPRSYSPLRYLRSM